MNETLSITVTGQVQGVYFRQSTMDQAAALDINGTVRNNDDGSVKIVASGKHENLQKLIDWCCQGPPKAEVQNVHVEKVPFIAFDGFRIVRE
jgi:acylphosphatase